MMDKLYNFALLDEFLENYSPKTVYGREDKGERALYGDAAVLERQYGRIALLINFLDSKSSDADKIEYHLSRIPRLGEEFRGSELRAEIFNVKKFLCNYRIIEDLLGGELRSEFSFAYDTAPLLELLGSDKAGEESFYIEERYSDDLASVRSSLRRINARLKKIRESRIGEIRELCGLDFRFHDFLVIDEDSIPLEREDLIFIEPYDNSSVRAKPSLGTEYYKVHNSGKELLEREKALEMEILQSLAASIGKEKKNLDRAVRAVTQLDISLARARLAVRFSCVRPRLGKDGQIGFRSLRLEPLHRQCRENGNSYTPLSVNFDNRNIVISGSNMGGKTMVLRTLLFAQLLAQSGFFVPAEEYRTVLFDSVNLIGGNSEEGKSGLSSFGEEIMNLIRSSNRGKTLYLIDEFARTTNSYEAFALNCAVLDFFSGNRDIWSFSSTHQDKLPVFENTSFWAMKGLDGDKYRKYFHSDYNGDLSERISLINSFMDYSLVPRSEQSTGRDALKIADILGLDAGIIDKAEKYMKLQEN